MTERAKLETAIEKEVFNLLRAVKEHTRDFTVLKIRRQYGEVDRETMTLVLDVVDQAIMDGFHTNIDKVMKNLDKPLSKFADEENPLPPTDE